MVETYSLANLGVRADTPFTLANLAIPDSSARAGSQMQAGRLGTQVLVKRPDGSQAWYTFDAERSTPGNPVLKAVGP